MLLDLVAGADALIEGFRPGVMERLGVGPDVCLARNPKLVFGRMTGWGQDGPYAPAAGHDINYISLAGALAHFGRAGQPPTPPINMVGDFGGGGMLLAFGVVCGLLEAQRSGAGQVIDAAMVDGSAVLMTMIWTLHNAGRYDTSRRGANMLDTGAHFYDVYECSDGEFVSIGSIEPQFYAELLRLTGLTGTSSSPAARCCGLARAEGALDRVVPDQDPRRVVCGDGAHRRVLRARAATRRGRPTSAQHRPGDLRRRLRRAATGTCTALQPNRARAVARRPPTTGSTRARCSTTGASTPERIADLLASGAVKQA